MMKFEQVCASLLEVLTIIGGVIGALFIGSTFLPSVSAPQGAELAAIGIGFAVIPYCLAGVFHRGAMRGMVGRDRL